MKFADSFRVARWVRLINLLLQAVLFLTLFGGLNYISQNHGWRFDLTRGHRFSLSAESRSYLERLERDVEIFVTVTDDKERSEVAQAYSDVSALLREYTYATREKSPGKGRVTARCLDVFIQRKEAESLGLENPDVVVVRCEGRRRTVTLSDLYRTEKRQRQAFQGEAALTAAILEVSNPERKKIYFVQGHGELRPDDVGPRGLSNLRDELIQRNYELAGLELALTRKVPDDAALLIVAGPKGRFQPFEEELLRNYLGTRAGRLIVLVGPGLKSIGLDNLFFDWGVWVYDNVIHDTSADYVTETGQLYLKHYLPHAITQNLISNDLPLLVGQSRAVSEDRGSTDDGLNVKTLVATSPTAWGESSYRLRIPPEYTPGQDLRGQLGILVVSERIKPADQIQFSVRGGHLAVLGTADIVDNSRIFNIGNLNLFLALTNWTIERDTQLNIPARPVERFQLALSSEELGRLRAGLLLIVPGSVALLGLIVYITRRN